MQELLFKIAIFDNKGLMDYLKISSTKGIVLLAITVVLAKDYK